MKTADELEAEGLRLAKKGERVVALFPTQISWAVEAQRPFIRIPMIPMKILRPNANAHD